jgi:teichuronic acid exporter
MEPTLRQKVLLGLSWSAGLKFLGQAASWIITIVVMRKLSPQDYGLMGMAGVIITYVARINELGLGAAIIQAEVVDERIKSQIFSLLIIVNCCLFLLCFLLAPIISTFFSEPRLVPIIRLLATQFVLASFTIIPQSLIVRDMLFKERSIVSLLALIAGSLTTLALALAEWGVWSLVWGSLILDLFMVAGLNIIKPCLFLPNFSLKGMGRIISFGGYITVSRIIWAFYSQADVIIVGKLLGQRLLGFYSVAISLASLPMEKISGIINQVAFPAFASIQSDSKTAASHFLKAIRLMSLMAFPVLWGISSISADLVDTLLGDKWVNVIVPLQIISLVIPVRMVSNLMSPILLGLGRADVQLFNVIVYSLVLPIGFLLGTRWGVVGVSMVWTAMFPLAFLFNMSRTARVLKMSLFDVVRQMIVPFAAAVIMYIAVGFLRAGIHDINQTIRLILCIIAGAVVYLSLIMIFAKDSYRETLALMRN